MHRDAFRDAAAFHNGLPCVLNAPVGHFGSVFRHEQPVLGLGLLPVLPKRLQSLFRQHGVPVASALSLADEDASVFAVYVGHLEVRGFGEPQAGAVDCHEQGLRTVTI